MAYKNCYNWNHDFPKLAHEAGFAFNSHKPKVVVDWNKIRVIDIEQVIRNRDFITVDRHISDVQDFRLDAQYDVKILDEGVVKLFRLAQLAIEYQLFCKQHLDRSLAALRDELRVAMQELERMRNEIHNKDEEIRKQRRRNKGCHSRHYTNLPYGNENIAAMILQTLSHRADLYTGKSVGETIVPPYNKCNFCDKVFLNQLYLQAHITRRHSGLDSQNLATNFPATSTYNNNLNISNDPLGPNLNPSPTEVVNTNQNYINTAAVPNFVTSSRADADLQQVPEKECSTVMPINIDVIDKLRLEVKELREQLSKNNVANTKEKEAIAESVDTNNSGKAAIKEVTNLNSHNDVTEISKVDVLMEKLEEWKKEEHSRYQEEVEALRKQMVDSVNAIRQEATSGIGNAENQHVERLMGVLKKQDEEIRTLKEMLEKNSHMPPPPQPDPTTQIIMERHLEEAQQQRILQQQLLDRLQALEGQVVAARRGAAEESAKAGQLQVMVQERDEKIRQLEAIVEETIKVGNGERENKQSQTSMSQDQLSDSNNRRPILKRQERPSSTQSADSRLQKSHNELQRKAQEILLRAKTFSLSETDSSDSIDYTVKPVKKPKDVVKLKNSMRSASSMKDIRKISKEYIIPERSRSENDTFDDRKKKVKNKEKMEVKRSDLNVKKQVQESIFTADESEEKENPRTGSESESSVEDRRPSSRMKERLNETYTVDSAESLDSQGSKGRKKRNKEKSERAVENSATEPKQLVARSKFSDTVNEKLLAMGVDPTRTRLPAATYQKQLALLKHRRDLQAKKTESYSKIRKGILSYLEMKVGESSQKKLDTSISPSKLYRTSKMSSILSNVKNKALSIMKSSEKNKKIERNQLNEEITKRAATLLKTPPSSRQSSPGHKASLNSGKGKSVLSHFEAKSTSNMRDKSSPVSPALKSTSEPNISMLSDKKNMRPELSDASDDLEASIVSSVSTSIDDLVKRPKSGNTIQIVTSAISHQPSKSIESLIKSPIRRPLSAESHNSKDSVLKREETTATRQLNKTALVSNETVTKLVSETSVQSMYATAVSDESDSASVHTYNKETPIFLSEDNLHTVQSSPKGVLKNVASNSSLSKKKVLFDLEANQMKSVSASPSQSVTVTNEMRVKATTSWEDDRSSAMKMKDSEWDLSSIEDIPIKPVRPVETVAADTKQSPKIAELAKRIEAQLAHKPLNKPPTGAVKVMQASALVSGSNTSIGSSLLDDEKSVDIPVPAPRFSSSGGGGGKIMSANKDGSDLEVSDWSIDDILNVK